MDKKLYKKEYLIIAIMFMVYFIWSCVQPLDGGPDESMRYNICQYIFNTGSLPRGDTPELINNIWGQSYAFTPILAYIIAVIPMKIVSIFTMDATSLLLAARFANVVMGAITIYFLLKITKYIFKNDILRYLFVIFVALLPQCTFLFTYVNNDGLALMSSSIIVYAWLRGFEKKWDYQSCMILAVGLSICLLSYYNAYGFVLVSFFLFIISMYIFNKPSWIKITIQKGLLITFVVFLLAGWWFIRNYIIYDGDFLGMNASNICAELNAAPHLKPSAIACGNNMGISLFEMLFSYSWLSNVVISFIARFGQMNIYPPAYFYYFYCGIALIGLIGIITHFKETFIKNDSTTLILNYSMLICLFIPNILNIYYSYFSDFQPQGRYSMPMIIPLAYFITLGTTQLIKNIKIKKIYIVFTTLFALFCIFYSIMFLIIPYYR